MFLFEKRAPYGKKANSKATSTPNSTATAKRTKPMASYHCTVKVGGKGKAAAHAAYISREGKYSGYDRYEDFEASAHGNMPAWAAHNPAHFWAAADEHERANGATYREIEVALPRELTPDQRKELVDDFIRREVGNDHAYQWAIHCPKAALERGEQPHAHIMYSERTIDGIERDPDQYFKRYNSKSPEKGGCRKDSAGTEERLQATRQRWADVQNQHLERHGHTVRVDHRSLKEQGINRQPEKHIGASRIKDMQQEDISALLSRRAAEGELERAQKQVSLIDLSGDLAAAKADRLAQEQAQLSELAKNQEAARAYARQATEQFKAEQAAREFARQATEQLKVGMAAKAEQERQQKIEQMRQQKEQERKIEIEKEQKLRPPPSRGMER